MEGLEFFASRQICNRARQLQDAMISTRRQVGRRRAQRDVPPPAELGETSFAEAWKRGQAEPYEVAVAEALASYATARQ